MTKLVNGPVTVPDSVNCFYGKVGKRRALTDPIIVPHSVNCFYDKVGKRSVLTKIKSVTVGGRMTRNDPGLGYATSCSPPKYVAGGW